MSKILLYGASVGTIVGTLSGYFNGATYGIILGLATFIFYVAIRFFSAK